MFDEWPFCDTITMSFKVIFNISQYNTIRHDTTGQGTTGRARRGRAEHGTTRHDTTRHNTTQNDYDYDYEMVLLRHTISTMYHGIIFKSCKKHNILQ